MENEEGSQEMDYMGVEHSEAGHCKGHEQKEL